MGRMVFNRYVDDPTTSEQDLHARSGQVVSVASEVDHGTYDFEDVGPIFNIVFDDGFEAQAFSDELTEVHE